MPSQGTDEPEPGPAELFEQFFGPSIFTPWSRVLLDHAEPEVGEHVLDLGCATGTVARRTAPRVGDEGRVVGLDIDPDMLRVAEERAAAEEITAEWHEGDATDLDFADDTFDLVLCQQGLQFFSDPAAALREAARVLVDGGRIALNVWQPLENHPVYSALLEAEARHLDEELEDVATPFTFGDAGRLEGLLGDAGFDGTTIIEKTLGVTFPEPDTFVALTVMAGAAVVPEVALDDPDERAALIEAVARDSEDVLERYREGEHLSFPMPNQIAIAYA